MWKNSVFPKLYNLLQKSRISSAPRLGRSSRDRSGRAASELESRRKGVFSWPGPARTACRPAAGRPERFLPGSLTPQQNQARPPHRRGRGSCPDCNTEHPPTPTARRRSGDNPEARRKSRPARLIGSYPTAEKSHWATKLLAKAPSHSHAQSLSLQGRAQRSSLFAESRSWPRDQSSLEGRAGWGRLLERRRKIYFWRGREQAGRYTPLYTLRSRGHGDQEGPDQAAQAGRVRSGFGAVGAQDPSGGLPLGGHGSGASGSLPAPHSPDRPKRRGRGLTTSARYPG